VSSGAAAPGSICCAWTVITGIFNSGTGGVSAGLTSGDSSIGFAGVISRLRGGSGAFVPPPPPPPPGPGRFRKTILLNRSLAVAAV
jgi:hypothetical protein